ncbi:DNA-directed RNA polymerase subunit alpha [Candidatus Falkowbacteria bacterium CG23_combo_of_CG06-09_8_20_14_all_49_15]|uniref:DNA-directed RNA polymerase subunit alpha n=1 Tax=Candidatus Falkowbacteria bacterium CG23_combo_of_CG06-09_8_20_14_all_49_15 TaxID=1974572 RepID=A0A2G9ZKE1_9BACT|nr:MAG: DNA-directed RNA polymerase subunit alpha [Candidatus Falkowbacteria bacterium CG23_combo_of_CG06-09_8_20_14_all_49_15]
MTTIDLPKNVRYEAGDSRKDGVIIIEPCYPGFGTTIGNALRRVLISSLPGGAIVGVKIEGVAHEFTTLNNVKEDILEILLNIKKIRLKIYGDEPIKLSLEQRGEKIVKAGDFDAHGLGEITNPDQTIATITDPSGQLLIEATAKNGLGYEMVENREEHAKEIGYIEIDSIFSPIVAVGFEIENVRVGKMTNWEKLILKIRTDGTISPEDAFKKAIKIILSQFEVLDLDRRAAEEVADEQAQAEIVETEEISPDISAEVSGAEEPAKKKRGRPRKIVE